MDWTLSLLAPALQPLFISLVRTPAKQRDPEAIARGIAACEKPFAVADGALEKQPWFAGEAFGIVDIPLGCLTYNWFNLPLERQPRPRLEAWYQALCERTAYQQRVMLPLS